MKLSIIAIAIAAASMTGAVQAEFKVSGDVTVSYQDDGTHGPASFDGAGTEVIFDASEKVGNVTIFGSATTNINGSGSSVSADDVYVGVKGAFGTVKAGDTDNGCDTVDTGWVADDVFISHSSGGCKGNDKSNLTYSNTRGAVTYAVSASPKDSQDNFALGIKGKMGPVTASLGYEKFGDIVNTAACTSHELLTSSGEVVCSNEPAQTVMDSPDNVVLGLSGNYGPVKLGVRANQFDGGDTDVGYTAQYSTGANKFYLGVGDVGDKDTTFLGYTRSIGKNTIAVVEWVDTDKATPDDKFAVGVKHSF